MTRWLFLTAILWSQIGLAANYKFSSQTRVLVSEKWSGFHIVALSVPETNVVRFSYCSKFCQNIGIQIHYTDLPTYQRLLLNAIERVRAEALRRSEPTYWQAVIGVSKNDDLAELLQMKENIGDIGLSYWILNSDESPEQRKIELTNLETLESLVREFAQIFSGPGE